MKEVNLDSSFSNLGYIMVCDTYYDKISEHLKLMNSWRLDPEFIKECPRFAEKEFTLFDALTDLLMKGLL